MPSIRRALLCATAVASICTTSVAPALAHDAPSRGPHHAGVLERGDRGTAVRGLQRKLGQRADGVFGRETSRAVRRYQRRHGLVADGLAGPTTLARLGLPAPAASRRDRAAASAAPVRVSPVLQRIAQCESGGNPRAVSPDGRYRGKYQFTRATWRSLGGKGDPAKASEAEQDRRAAKLFAQSGTAPWPACGTA